MRLLVSELTPGNVVYAPTYWVDLEPEDASPMLVKGFFTHESGLFNSGLTKGATFISIDPNELGCHTVRNLLLERYVFTTQDEYLTWLDDEKDKVSETLS